MISNNAEYKAPKPVGFSIPASEKPTSAQFNEEIDKILDYLFLKVKEEIKENAILFSDVERMLVNLLMDKTKSIKKKKLNL